MVGFRADAAGIAAYQAGIDLRNIHDVDAVHGTVIVFDDLFLGRRPDVPPARVRFPGLPYSLLALHGLVREGDCGAGQELSHLVPPVIDHC